MGLDFKTTGEKANTEFAALPLGRYNLRVEDAELTTASTGNQMITTTFVVMDGDFKNRKLWNNFTLTPKALIFLHQFLKAAGSNFLDQDDVQPEEVAKEMFGMEVSAYTEPGVTNTGNPNNKLSQWKEVSGKTSSDLLN